MQSPRPSRSLPFALALLAAPAAAQWSSDAAVNLAIADRPSEQVLPKIASTADNGLWIGWFDIASGNYDVYLQRLDAAGNELFPHGGILVSAHPQNTSLVDWDLITAADGDAVLVFSDARAGSDLDVYAYRISSSGAFVWGPDGVTLSANADFEPTPRVVEASDGDLVFVWARFPSAADGSLRMQRLSPAGTPRLIADGLAVVQQAGEDPGFVEIAAADAGSVILAWVRDISTFQSPRHLRARKFDAAGAPLWPAELAVHDASSLPIAHAPIVRADGQGGAILVWHRALGSLFGSLVQHLDAGGAELFAHGGVEVSTAAGLNHLDPTLSYLPASGEILVFWRELNGAQSQYGISGQKLSPTGVRQWGAAGATLLPMGAEFTFALRSRPLGDGAVVFFLHEPAGGGGAERVRGMRVDGGGALVWPMPIVTVASTLSAKGRLPVAIDAVGTAKLVWEDDRGGSVDLYAQNVRADGGLGNPTALASIYGCGLNPPGSVSVLAGAPALGTTVVIGLDNPLGTQAPGALPVLALANAPDAHFPCGTPLAAFGMGPGPGELLIDLLPPNPLLPLRIGPPWAGPGTPTPVAIGVPSAPSLLGRTFYAQGVLFDPTSVLERFGLTDAVALFVGT
jgi:hypothetical protein